jgi:hypothetical protein
MKINLGGGYKRFSGYFNVDCDTNCKPDYIINLDDINLKLPFEDDSITDIKAHHILEHIGAGYFKLLQELYRVCESGAIIDVKVPHPCHEVYLNDPTHKRPITVEGMRLFSKKANKLEIERSGTSSTLGIIYDVDFEIVDFKFVYDSFYDSILPTLPREQFMRLMREALNVCIEIEMRLQVIK